MILGAAVYTPQSVAGFQYFNKNAPVEIIGQGRGKTFLTGGLGLRFACPKTRPWR